MTDLVEPYGIASCDCDDLLVTPGWARRWTATWRVNGAEIVCPVRDMASVPPGRVEPLRRFAWRTGQRHRPGLQYLVSIGRHHGFESMAEQRLLLALDFVPGLLDVYSQPLLLRYGTRAGWRRHVPDFLTVTNGGTTLIDVRPGARITGEDREAFAATAEAALAVGWCYLVVPGWRAQVMTTIDALSAQRRQLHDPLGVIAVLLAAVGQRGSTVGQLVAGCTMPALGRAFVVHLLWHRRLGVDLALPLTDRSPIWPAAPAAP
ncbi:TnsA-like heteromeric transposase endonuclease subunit [Actinoplanes sp. NPDC051470]|uniref:TnsA-like heteromeric transposase endonuclease subunit n=1 Tax=Actinoplanes sp. NPDC051470 TaxID=3157224 RepID=UPI003436F12D